MRQIDISGLAGCRELMRSRVKLYCGYDTHSISVERAGEIMRSTEYVLRAGLKSDGACACDDKAGLTNARDAFCIFDAGVKKLERQIEIEQGALRFARATAPAVDNLAYAHTLGVGLEVFFRRYDIQFAAHEIPADIDYPLCLPVQDELCGLDYIHEYIKRLTYENLFLDGFKAETINGLLKTRFASPRELIFNIFFEVLNTALLSETGDAATPERVARAVDKMCAELTQAAREYVTSAALDAARYLCARQYMARE